MQNYRTYFLDQDGTFRTQSIWNAPTTNNKGMRQEIFI
jgi:hypothetical protein